MENQPDPAAAPEPRPIPVLCDICRATGVAGDPLFAAIPDILAFAPVPRRAHVNGWTPEHQRAFIAALAITGSPRRAARAIGRHAFGAEQLRAAQGGRAFAQAWDAALDLAREREFARIHANLADLAATTDADYAEADYTALPPPRRDRANLPTLCQPARDYYEDDAEPDRQDYVDAMFRCRDRLTRARRLLLLTIADDSAKRAAWETLVGPVDWTKAERLEAQPDEPFNDDPESLPRMANPDMLLTAEAGLLAEWTGGKDALADIKASLSTESNPNDGAADASG